ERSRHRRGLLHATPPHHRRHETKPDDRGPSLRGHVCETGRGVAVRRAPPLRRLDRGARAVVTATRRVVIVGASGMVGGYALRYLLEDAAVGGVTSIGRRKLGISHPRLTEILHADFADCSPLAGALTGHDAAVFCLGVYTGS